MLAARTAMHDDGDADWWCAGKEHRAGPHRRRQQGRRTATEHRSRGAARARRTAGHDHADDLEQIYNARRDPARVRRHQGRSRYLVDQRRAVWARRTARCPGTGRPPRGGEWCGPRPGVAIGDGQIFVVDTVITPSAESVHEDNCERKVRPLHMCERRVTDVRTQDSRLLTPGGRTARGGVGL